MRCRGNCKRRGTAVAELAVLLPFIVFLFVAAVDFGRVFYYSQIIENCARQGALYACDSKSAAANLYANVTDAATADATGLSPKPTVSSTTGTDKASNPWVSVTVTWKFSTLTTFPWIPQDTSISRTVQMRKVS